MLQTIKCFLAAVWLFNLLEYFGYAILFTVALVLGIGALKALARLAVEGYKSRRNTRRESDFSN